MEKTIKFYKEDNKWYADIPNHTKDENEMVMGADYILDMLAEENRDVLFITVSDEESSQFLLQFNMKSHDDEGAYYQVSGVLYNQISWMLMEMFPDWEHEIWICNVTHDIFGSHPKNIYLLKIE